MPDVTLRTAVRALKASAWDFVSDLRNWAEFLPGYESMDVIDDVDSVWRVRGDAGILTRLVTLNVHVTEWIAGSRVAFDIECVEEPLTGAGFLLVEPDGDGTVLTFRLGAEAGGMMAPVVDALIGPAMAKMAEAFATAIKSEIESREQASAPSTS